MRSPSSQFYQGKKTENFDAHGLAKSRTATWLPIWVWDTASLLDSWIYIARKMPQISVKQAPVGWWLVWGWYYPWYIIVIQERDILRSEPSSTYNGMTCSDIVQDFEQMLISVSYSDQTNRI